MKEIVTGSDYGGFNLKNELVNYLKSKSYLVEDMGTYSANSCHYPDFAHKVAENVSTGKKNRDSYLYIGAGNVITANKHKGVRSALCWNTKISSLARAHNNANVLCLPANFIVLEDAVKIIESFLSTKFEGSRHAERVGLIESAVQIIK